jgi:hypothetical protein
MLINPKEHDTLSMEVNEPVEEPKTEETLPDFVAEAVPEEVQQSVAWQPSWLRFAYSAEFLLALLTIFTVWSEVGGQGHLDLMPWYTKLICVVATAWCCVRFTAGIVEHQKVWNGRTIAWFGGIVALCMVMGAITYYYHLHEEPDQPDSDETTTTAMSGSTPRSPFILPSDRT